MSILTLVENAVKHGLAPRPEGGNVHVVGAVRDGMLGRLAVERADGEAVLRSTLGDALG